MHNLLCPAHSVPHVIVEVASVNMLSISRQHSDSVGFGLHERRQSLRLPATCSYILVRASALPCQVALALEH